MAMHVIAHETLATSGCASSEDTGKVGNQYQQPQPLLHWSDYSVIFPEGGKGSYSSNVTKGD